MFEFHDVQQNTEVWESLRIGKVTNSYAPTFMANLGKAFGDPAKDYALTIALEQMNGVKSVNAGFSNFQMDRAMSRSQSPESYTKKRPSVLRRMAVSFAGEIMVILLTV